MKNTQYQNPFDDNFLLVRIYFGGVYFPMVKSISINQSAGGATMDADLPPSPSIRPEELVGMPVHIFYANRRVVDLFGDDYGNDIPDDDGWPILFQGEMAAFSQNNSVEGESLSFSFVGHSGHFDQTLMFFYDADKQKNPMGVQFQAYFIGNTGIQLDSSTAVGRTTSIFTAMGDMIDGLGDSDDSRNIAFTASILAILREAEQRHALFGYFNNKFKLDQRFCAYPDPDINRLMTLKRLHYMAEQRATALADDTSLTDMMQIVTSMIKYNWVHIAQPIYKKGIPLLEQSAIGADGTEEFYELIRQGSDSYVKTGLFLGEKISAPAGSRKVAQRFFENELYKAFIEVRKGDSSFMYEGEGFGELDPLRSEVLGKLDNKRLMILAAEKVVLEKKIVPSFDGTWSKDKSSGAETREALPEVGEPKQGENVYSATELEQQYLERRDEMHEYTITPMMMFASPPKCNVIFPKDTAHYGISRNMRQEITRLMGRAQIMPSANGGAEAIEWYIAPRVQAFHKLSGNVLDRYTDAYTNYMDFVTGDVER
jgi:hypothetical protein